MAVENVDLGKYRPSCNLAHGLINELSVIVGYCDLVMEDTPETSKCRMRLEKIHSIAKHMAEELQQHQCELEVIAREAANRRPTNVSHVT